MTEAQIQALKILSANARKVYRCNVRGKTVNPIMIKEINPHLFSK